MNEISRIGKDLYYGKIALQVAERSTCLRRKHGAIIVKDDRIISTGYNGAPRSTLNCNEIHMCLREKMHVPRGQRYELCRSVHAEANAIINAAASEMKDATLYLAGMELVYDENGAASTTRELSNPESCAMCKRMIINAGIKYVVYYGNGTTTKVNVFDWIADDSSLALTSVDDPEYIAAVQSVKDKQKRSAAINDMINDVISGA